MCSDNLIGFDLFIPYFNSLSILYLNQVKPLK